MSITQAALLLIGAGLLVYGVFSFDQAQPMRLKPAACLLVGFALVGVGLNF